MEECKSIRDLKNRLKFLLEKVTDPQEGKNYKLGLTKKILKEIIDDIEFLSQI